ncbi:DUF7289 family protein [Salinirubrum litoreum]|uniref:DUF7305 domain-containing protein n=1 Tax=Salinirubrum litoreum TaxID=1126234 RepID=A0ABD5REJ8_9EURY|nr:hypothetical protein [Salinirubrum litoreum]
MLLDGDRRAQSNVIGIILIIGLALSTSVVVVALGGSSISQYQEEAQLRSAEHALSELDSKLSLVALSEGISSRSIDLGLTNDESVSVEDAGHLEIWMTPSGGGPRTDIVDQDLGTIRYDGPGEESIAYQGGGVWRRSAGGTTMVSPPEMHYRGRTLTVPLVTVDGAVGGSNGRITAEKTGQTPKFPITGDPDRSNAVQDKQIFMKVQSDYYRAWGQFFGTRLGGTVNYYQSNRTARMKLVAPANAPPLQGGLVSTHAGSQIEMKGGGGSAAFIDTYDSDSAPYSFTGTVAGTVSLSNDLWMRGGTEVYADVTVPPGYSTDTKGGSDIKGSVGTNDVDVSDVGPLVNDQQSTLSQDANNDNDATSAITSSDQLDPGQTTWTLTNGNYYIDGDLTLAGGETLVIDNSGGEVNLVVDGDVALNGGQIEVADGSGSKVSIYMTGNTLDIDSGGGSVIPGDKSPKLWLYAGPGLLIDIRNSGTEFVGVIYAPDDSLGNGNVNIQAQGQVSGAVVGGSTTLRSGASIHYDRALDGVDPLAGGSPFPELTYLHVTVNEVEVDEA